MSKSIATSRIQTVAPKLATEWMKSNCGNRHISGPHVAGLVDEMLTGRFVLTGDAIQFNRAGELINGQHRLQAVIDSGVACTFLIMEGVEDEAKAVLDKGRGRSVPDALRMCHGVERARMITATVASLDDFAYDRRLKVSPGHVLERMADHEAAFRWAVDSIPGKTVFSGAPITAALVYAHKADPTSVEEFARRMFNGADLRGDSPILQFRNFVIRQGGSGVLHDEKRNTYFLLLLSIVKFVQGGSVRVLRRNDDAVTAFFAPHYPVAKRHAA